LGHVWEDVNEGENPLQFRRVDGEKVYWKLAVDVASDIVDMNLSRKEGIHSSRVF